MSTTPTLGLALPAHASPNWDTPLNDNFTKIDTAFAGLAGVLTTTVALTADQCKTLNSAPVQLLTAPGANKQLVPLSMVVKYTFGTVPYALVTKLGTQGLYTFDGTTANDLIQELSGADSLLQNSVDGVAQALLITNQRALVNTPLNLMTDFDDPNGDGTLSVTVYYTIVDLS